MNPILAIVYAALSNETGAHFLDQCKSTICACSKDEACDHLQAVIRLIRGEAIQTLQIEPTVCEEARRVIADRKRFVFNEGELERECILWTNFQKDCILIREGFEQDSAQCFEQDPAQ